MASVHFIIPAYVYKVFFLQFFFLRTYHKICFLLAQRGHKTCGCGGGGGLPRNLKYVCGGFLFACAAYAVVTMLMCVTYYKKKKKIFRRRETKTNWKSHLKDQPARISTACTMERCINISGTFSTFPWCVRVHHHMHICVNCAAKEGTHDAICDWQE